MGLVNIKKIQLNKWKLLLIFVFGILLLFSFSKISLCINAKIASDTVVFSSNSTSITTKWSAETNISNIDEYNSDTPASVIDSKDNIHIVWSEEGQNRDREIYYKMYHNRIREWSGTQTISNLLTSDYGSVYPVIKVDYKDNLHIIWRVAGLSSQNINYRYSINGIWSEIITVTSCNQTVFSHDLTPTAKGNIFFIWGNDYDLYYKIYSHETKTWTTEQQLTNTTKHDGQPSVDSDINSNIHLSWSGGSDELIKAEIFYQYLSRENWTLGEKIIISPIDNIRSVDPKILIDRKDIVNIIWSDDDYLISDTYYGEIHNNILTNMIRLNNEDIALYHEFFVDYDNNIHFVWLDGYSYRYRIKTANGFWSEEIVVKEHEELTLTNDLTIIVNSKNFIKIFYRKWNGNSWELYSIAGKVSYNFEVLVYLSSIAVSLSITLVIVLINFIKKNKK